jgi:hypothetical protein
MPARSGKGGRRAMIKFLMGVIVGILIFFFFLYFGGGKTVKRIGEGLTDTGKKMEVLEETISKEKEDMGKGIQKKFFKEEKEIQKRSQ